MTFLKTSSLLTMSQNLNRNCPESLVSTTRTTKKKLPFKIYLRLKLVSEMAGLLIQMLGLN